MTETSPSAHDAARAARRARTLTETLGSIVLACELVVMFLASLVAFGLNALAPLSLPPAACLVVGGTLCVALVVTMGMLRRPSGQILGWVLQALIIATGFFVPVMFFIGALFAAMWTYAIITGRRIDHRKADSQKEQA